MPSFSGGLDPWGKPFRKKTREVRSDLIHFLSLSTPELPNEKACLQQCISSTEIHLLIIDIIDFQRGFTPPFVDDGLIEIVGFRDAWHGLVLLAPNGHGTRLAQVSR